MKLIELKKLNIGYGNKIVCKDINFTIEQGQYICVVGENGSGKSTLLKTILGLNKAVSGKIDFNEEMCKGIGYLPQQTEILEGLEHFRVRIISIHHHHTTGAQGG